MEISMDFYGSNFGIGRTVEFTFLIKNYQML